MNSHSFAFFVFFCGSFCGNSIFLAQAAGPAEAPSYVAPTSQRVVKTINREWTFNYFPAENADALGCETPGYNDSAWPAIALPHTWQTFETTGKLHPFIYDAAEKDDPYWWYGWGWYRKHFSVARDQSAQKVFVEFDGVQKYCKVFVNGKLVGDHKGGYTGFYFDITDLVRFGEDNLLAVAVNNRQNDPFKIPPMSAGNFDIYGGIYRDVRLVIKDRLYVPFQGSYQHEGGTFVTTPEVSEASAKARIRTWVKNEYQEARDCELRTTIADAKGNVVHVLTSKKKLAPNELAEFDQTSPPIARPRLWSPDTPYLYTVHSDVYELGLSTPTLQHSNTPFAVPADHFESPLGFRAYHWDYDNNRLILNGKKVIIHGSNRHQEYPWLGDATPKWLHLADMRDFRFNLNHNFMRKAHYPNDPCIYDFNDRYGIITIEETPNIKRQEFSAEVQVQQLREMIRRDRNHPAIFFWSMGNETDHAVDSKYAVEEDTTRIIHARDIYNDSAGTNVGTTSKELALESLLRCTIRGWYNANVRDLEPESAQQTGHETWQHDLNALEIIKRNQGRAPDDRANLNTWLYEDHGCDRHYGNCPLLNVNPKGFVDCWRTPKYFYYLWQAVYAEKPMVFIHPHFWRAQYLGQKKEVVVDSNCDSVELKVNGRTVGTLNPRFDQANVVRFKDVLVEPGTLTAVGKKGGQTVTAQVVMAGPPARLVVSAVTQEPIEATPHSALPNPHLQVPHSEIRTPHLEAGLDSVALIRSDIVDADGHHVYGATNTLRWTVSGPATLAGAPVYTTDIAKYEEPGGTMYIDAPAFNVIRSTGKPGEIKVRVLSPGLASAEVRLAATPAARDNSVAITEPPLPETHRQPVAREGNAGSVRELALEEMKGVSEDLQLTEANQENYTQQIDQFLRAKNPDLDFARPEYQAVVRVFARLLQNNQGSLVRDDFNFTVGFYNDCRRITRRIAGLQVPPLFKDALRKHYAATIIEQGEAKDFTVEAHWLASLPQGRVVVAGTPEGAARHPGVLYAEQTELWPLAARAQPDFKDIDAERRLAVLDALWKLNPWVHRTAVRSGGEKVDGVRQKTTETFNYQVPPGNPILVPDLKYLEEQGAGASQTGKKTKRNRDKSWQSQNPPRAT